MTDWAKLKVVDLKAELKNRDLPQNGLKADLVARLEEADQEGGETEHREELEGAPVTNELKGDEPLVEEPVVEEPEPQDAIDEPNHVDEKPDEKMGETEEKEMNEIAAPTVDEEPSKGVESGDKQHEVINNGTSDEISQDADMTVDVPITGDGVDSQSRELTAEEKPGVGTVTTTVDSTPSHSLEPTPAAEQQKRKRRSLTPPPTEESIARKRARTEEIADEGANLGSRAEDLLPDGANESAPMNIDGEPQTENNQNEPLQAPAPESKEEDPIENMEIQQDMDYDRDVSPAMHPATSALYIKNFMRPLRPQDVKSYLIELATHPRDPLDDDVVVEFFLDQIRTHGFVIFKTTAAASRVRTALHDSVWPNESNRKPLWVDFVPPEKVRDWIDTEQASGGPRSGVRWEVIYDSGPEGVIEARLEEATGTGPHPGTKPQVSTAMAMDSIPVGPRALRDPAIPTGPRPVRPGTGPGPRPPPINPGGASKRTNTRPVIHYQPVSEDLARRRIDNMRSYYTTKRDGGFGREINRYSFENGTSFVDRGKEVFEGIRPPHRERGGMGRERRERRGGRRRRGGGGGGRPRSDRYLPPPRNDRRSRRGSVSDDGDTRMRD
ncbi:sap protein [Fusarium longipes]|uniref:Sap protein n=1 Tax=Fusarium longipes TaxID=694270 RepID=A0A395SYZ1_9HYPO|nr:sap protein [Fusarium longipes]